MPLFEAADGWGLLGDNRPPVEFGEEPFLTLPAMPLGEAVR
ncbi:MULTISPECIES: hypothetical protein [Nitrospirillum]|nr:MULTISPECIES: hypothetical protein [Nitrospirillum]MEA1673975.1 hypothetical protein [Nitrospirillum sp. BR 11163]